MPDLYEVWRRRNEAAQILAKRLGLVPENIVMQDDIMMNMEFIEGESCALWAYEEFVRDSTTGAHMFEGIEFLREERTARVPLELLREYTNHVKYGLPNE